MKFNYQHTEDVLKIFNDSFNNNNYDLNSSKLLVVDIEERFATNKKLIKSIKGAIAELISKNIIEKKEEFYQLTPYGIKITTELFSIIPNRNLSSMADNERVYETARRKKSHKWVSSQSYGGGADAITRTKMQPMVSHCTKCGLNFQMFKIKPEYCVK